MKADLWRPRPAKGTAVPDESLEVLVFEMGGQRYGLRPAPSAYCCAPWP